jgi:F0F1-type ATP synthase assembly protein I
MQLPRAGNRSRLPEPVPFDMNLTGLRLRLVLRVVLLQVGCATLTGVLFWIFGGFAAALAAFTGGMIVAVGSVLFGWRMFAPGIAPAGRWLRAMIAAETLKWVWYVLALWAALARLRLAAAALIVGIVAAQFGHWLSLIGTKRGL